MINPGLIVIEIWTWPLNFDKMLTLTLLRVKQYHESSFASETMELKLYKKVHSLFCQSKENVFKKFNPLLYWFYIEKLGYEIILASKPIFPDIHIKACMTGMHSLHLNKTMQCMAIVNCIKMMSIHVYIYIIMLNSSNTLYLYT